MDADGGSADTLLTCARDGVETRLQCRECGAPICPACFVRTAVGFRCESCGAGKRVLAVGVEGRRTPLLVAVTVVVVLVIAAGAWAATRSGSGSPADLGDGGERMAIPTVQLGQGELPNGTTWTLEARRDGQVCTTLRTSPGSSPSESCRRTVVSRAIHDTTTRAVRGPAGTVYLTLIQVSDRIERVRVASEGGEARDMPTLGADSGLGVRFLVTYTTENVDESYTALAGDGTVLGQFNRPKMPRS